jgi:hypothetical protein
MYPFDSDERTDGEGMAEKGGLFLYQFDLFAREGVLISLEDYGNVTRIYLASPALPPKILTCDHGGAGAEEGIEDYLPGLRLLRRTCDSVSEPRTITAPTRPEVAGILMESVFLRMMLNVTGSSPILG